MACLCVGAAVAGAKWKLPPPQASTASSTGAHAESRIVQALAQWDAGWYLRIATQGYSLTPGEQSPVAYFPAFPLAIRAASWVGLNPRWAGVGLSWLFGLAGLAVFSRWAQAAASNLTTPVAAEGGGGTGVGGTAADESRAATLLLACYPFAIYLYGVVYSDGLFLLLCATAFLAVERDRPGWATLFGMLATATRPVAPAVVLGLVLRGVERKWSSGQRLGARDFLPAAAGLGLVAYMGYLQWRFGDALAFVHVQSSPGWDQPPGWHSWSKEVWLEQWQRNEAPLISLRLLAHPALTLLALALVWPTRRLLGWGYAVYVAVAVGLPALSSKDFQGMGRYVIAAFPLFLVMTLLLLRWPRALRALTVASAVVALGCAALFGSGFYLA